MTKDTPETHPIGCVGKDGSAESANYLRSLELFTANEEEDIRKQWTAAEDWSDFLQLNRAFLSGEAKLSCYHLGPIIPETEPLVPGLLRLHDYGLLTHESQPSETKGPFTDTCPCCDDESYVETHQRPFLSFIMPYDCEAIPQECVRRFLVELMTDEGPYVSILNFDGNCRFGRCRTKLRVACNFPDDWSTHIERVALTKELLHASAPRQRQLIDPECSCMLRAFATTSGLMESVHPLVVNVLAKTWEEEDLAGLVEKAAVRAGLSRIYAE